MKYISEHGQLIHKSEGSGSFKVVNTIKSYYLSEEELKDIKLRKIKTNDFSKLMNEYFKSVKHKWEYEGVKYKKLDNFESDGREGSFTRGNLINNYEYDKLPKHDDGLILVYHWGRLYFFRVSYGGYRQGQLFDLKTKQFVRWTQAKHCAPVMNCDTKEII